VPRWLARPGQARPGLRPAQLLEAAAACSLVPRAGGSGLNRVRLCGDSGRGAAF